MQKLRQKQDESQKDFQARQKKAQFDQKHICYGKMLWNSTKDGTYVRKDYPTPKPSHPIFNNSYKMKEEKIAKMKRQNGHLNE